MFKLSTYGALPSLERLQQLAGGKQKTAHDNGSPPAGLYRYHARYTSHFILTVSQTLVKKQNIFG